MTDTILPSEVMLMKLNRITRTLLAALCILLVTLVFFSIWKIVSILHGYKAAERRYSALTDSVVSVQAAPSADPAAAETQSQEDAAAPSEPAEPRERSPIAIDFTALAQRCGDIVGWLYLPDTVINYPVVQGSDNEYYLTRFLDGSPNGGGTLFLDFVCPSDFSGCNSIIYGHNMRDGSMFALVDDYGDQAFYEAHPVLYLNTPAQNYRLDVFSGFTTDPESFVYSTDFASGDAQRDFLNRLLAASEIRCSCPLNAADRVVTLSTCTYSGEDVRFVLCCKITEID